MRLGQDLQLQQNVLDLTLWLGISTLQRHLHSSKTFRPASPVITVSSSACSLALPCCGLHGTSKLPPSRKLFRPPARQSGHLPFLLPCPVPAGPPGSLQCGIWQDARGSVRLSQPALPALGWRLPLPFLLPLLLSQRLKVRSLWTAAAGALTHTEGSSPAWLLGLLSTCPVMISWAPFSVVFQKVCGVLRGRPAQG